MTHRQWCDDMISELLGIAGLYLWAAMWYRNGGRSVAALFRSPDVQ